MSRSAKHAKGMGAEGDDVAILQQSAYLRALVRKLHTEKVASLFRQMFNHILVFGTDIYLQAIGMEEGHVAEVMVQMAMCCQQANGRQLMVGNILLKGHVFLFVVCATVNDDTLLRLVAYHVAVFLQGVTLYTFNIKH